MFAGKIHRMSIRVITSADIEVWAALRARLWDDMSVEQHKAEAAEMLARPEDAFVAFLDTGGGSEIRGFAEAALRHDYVNGCDTSPVAYLEGIYVVPRFRGSGVGVGLLSAVQEWSRDRGCSELASDVDLENLDSQAFHTAVGFEETERVVYFRKHL